MQFKTEHPCALSLTVIDATPTVSIANHLPEHTITPLFNKEFFIQHKTSGSCFLLVIIVFLCADCGAVIFDKRLLPISSIKGE